jgi:hypothetical protein
VTSRIDRALTPVALLAALALVAQSEWALALAVGWPVWVAWCAPVALDAYVLAAVRTRRDMGPAVLVSSLSVLASHAVHAAPSAWASGVVGDGHLVPALAASCSVVPLLVAWRIHHIDTRRRTGWTSAPRTKTPAAPATPTPTTGTTTPSATRSATALVAVPSSGGARDQVRQVALAMQARDGKLPGRQRLMTEAGCSEKTARVVLEDLRVAA